MPDRVRRWVEEVGRRKIARELQEYHSPPEWRIWPFLRRNHEPAYRQVFRSLVQVNFYRTPRRENSLTDRVAASH
jgi:hypothetical protein